MKVSKRKLIKLIHEIISETKRLTPRERLAQMKAARAQKQATIDAAEIDGPIEAGYAVTLSNGKKETLPSTQIDFNKSKFKSMGDLYPLIGATYDPGQSASGTVFNSKLDVLRYYKEMTKMKRTQSQAAGFEAIKNNTSKKRFFGLFEENKINRRELRKLIKEELERLSYVSKEQGHTYGIEHLPDRYDQKKADDIIGHT